MPPSRRSHGAAIAFLHTAAIHIETFNALGREIAPELALTHVVREDLLAAAEKAGRVTPALDFMTQEALIALAEGGARVVVCTCSTLGASSVSTQARAGRPARASSVGAWRAREWRAYTMRARSGPTAV